MNPGNVGYGRMVPSLAPNAPTRIAPPEWRSLELIMATVSNKVVPANVYQMRVEVVSGGGGGARYAAHIATGGGGGGYGSAIIDVIPGQLLPTITIGAGGAAQLTDITAGNAGGTSSFGTFISVTGGAGGTIQAAGAATLAGGAGGGVDDCS